MPITDVSQMNLSLDLFYGTGRGSLAADSHELALYVGDPQLDGVEIVEADNPGYARAAVLPADWPDASQGAKSALVVFDDPTDAWSDAPNYWQLIDPVTGDLADGAPLEEPLIVTGPGDLEVAITVRYADVYEQN